MNQKVNVHIAEEISVPKGASIALTPAGAIAGFLLADDRCVPMFDQAI